MEIKVKVSEWGNINPSNWNKRDMGFGKSYEVYLDGKKVLNKSSEEKSYLQFGEDYRNRNVEFFTYSTSEDYLKAGWFFEPGGVLNMDGTLDYDFLMED
jgi:hypothetical protein